MSAFVSSAANAYASVAKLGGHAPSSSDVPKVPSLGGSGASQPSFPELVGSALDKAMATTYTGEATSIKAIAGKAELHEMVTAVANAELTLNTVVAVRDKVITAYQDILKMPI